jgi:hypothetical protein
MKESRKMRGIRFVLLSSALTRGLVLYLVDALTCLHSWRMQDEPGLVYLAVCMAFVISFGSAVEAWVLRSYGTSKLSITVWLFYFLVYNIISSGLYYLMSLTTVCGRPGIVWICWPILGLISMIIAIIFLIGASLMRSSQSTCLYENDDRSRPE